MSVAAAAGRVPSASLLPSGRWLPTEAPPPPPAGGALQPAAVQEVLAFLFLTVTVAAVIVALLFHVSLVPCERASSSLAEPHLDLDL